jgi:ABC-2 type transport system permease protein
VTEDNEAILGSVQNLARVLQAGGILILHIIGFLAASIIVFKKKDVLS